MKGKEIERKFLIWENGKSHANKEFLNLFTRIKNLKGDMGQYAQDEGHKIEQGYLPLELAYKLVKIHEIEAPFFPSEARIRWELEEITLGLKDSGSIERKEVEGDIDETSYTIYWPITEGKRIFKRRFERKLGKHTVEVNYFTDRDLIMAEIEFPSVEEAVKFPELGKDVTENRKYYNVNLAK